MTGINEIYLKCLSPFALYTHTHINANGALSKVEKAKFNVVIYQEVTFDRSKITL